MKKYLFSSVILLGIITFAFSDNFYQNRSRRGFYGYEQRSRINSSTSTSIQREGVSEGAPNTVQPVIVPMEQIRSQYSNAVNEFLNNPSQDSAEKYVEAARLLDDRIDLLQNILTEFFKTQSTNQYRGSLDSVIYPNSDPLSNEMMVISKKIMIGAFLDYSNDENTAYSRFAEKLLSQFGNMGFRFWIAVAGREDLYSVTNTLYRQAEDTFIDQERKLGNVFGVPAYPSFVAFEPISGMYTMVMIKRATFRDIEEEIAKFYRTIYLSQGVNAYNRIENTDRGLIRR